MKRKSLVKISHLGIFAAFPWQIPVREMYEWVFRKLREKYDKKIDFDIFYGSKANTAYPDKTEIEEFRYLSHPLFDTFLERIKQCDIFIADVTGFNPNVMTELGTAIALKKKIIILSNYEYSKINFDIQHLHIQQYKDKNKLLDKLKKVLRVYLKIVNHTLTDPIPGNLFNFSVLPFDTVINKIPPTKNLNINFEFQFKKIRNEMDWVGVDLRLRDGLSWLVYIRHNGSVEAILFPPHTYRQVGRVKKPFTLGKKYLCEIVLFEDEMEVYISDNEVNRQPILPSVDIPYMQFGQVRFRQQEHSQGKGRLETEISNIKILNKDISAPY